MILCFFELSKVFKGTGKGNKDEVKAINNYLVKGRNTISNNYKQLQLKGKMLSAKAVKDLYLEAEEEVHILSRLFIYHNKTSLKNSNKEIYMRSNLFFLNSVGVQPYLFLKTVAK